MNEMNHIYIQSNNSVVLIKENCFWFGNVMGNDQGVAGNIHMLYGHIE